MRLKWNAPIFARHWRTLFHLHDEVVFQEEWSERKPDPTSWASMRASGECFVHGVRCVDFVDHLGRTWAQEKTIVMSEHEPVGEVYSTRFERVLRPL